MSCSKNIQNENKNEKIHIKPCSVVLNRGKPIHLFVHNANHYKSYYFIVVNNKNIDTTKPKINKYDSRIFSEELISRY